ncbi:MerR family transcriptional regulator [Acerihabitans sp. TG2]|uniref:MerR family transcriptional regulator n=1 Tax=Acerihabitans sp. TG2 TaxID=3096008 RepID=UPI002B23B72D|nr:MerR family transcriptional regulator [Acerihabitans sp. TG2]MEA9392556.1 MerR family transcriptional regulator [Acerihabitans sp. TG2]
MSFYSIGEVARICGINPVTLRAWQRRYGLLKPQRTEGGHRLFNDEDLQTIQAILGWIERGVPVGQVKALLEGSVTTPSGDWSQFEHRLLSALQNGRSQTVRQTIRELGREYPAASLVNHVFRPLRTRLNSGDHRLRMLLSQLDGLLIEHAVMCANAARKRPGNRTMLLGWGHMDSVELWLEAMIRCEEGRQVEVLAIPVDDPYLDNTEKGQWLIWAEGKLTQRQHLKLAQWHERGISVTLLGSAAMLMATDTNVKPASAATSHLGSGATTDLFDDRTVLALRSVRKKDE